MTFGDELVALIRAHLRENGWERLGQLKDGAAVIARLADELWERRKPKKAPRTAFVPPSPEEVTEYSASIGYPMNGQDWCDTYATKGWVVGGSSKMKDWKAAVRKWKANGWQIGNGGHDAPQRQSASLGALQVQLGKVERELTDILRPGGAAYNVTPTGEKMERYTLLMEQRKGLLAKIAEFGS